MKNKVWSYRLYDIAYMVKKLTMPHMGDIMLKTYIVFTFTAIF